MKFLNTGLIDNTDQHGFLNSKYLYFYLEKKDAIISSFAIFFSKAKTFWKNAPQAPLLNVRSTSVWKQHRLAMVLLEFRINGEEQ